jgi:hypothetical protein
LDFPGVLGGKKDMHGCHVVNIRGQVVGLGALSELTLFSSLHGSPHIWGFGTISQI